MFTPEQYRVKAAEYGELLKTTTAPREIREYRQLERSFATLADNEQWLADHHHNTVHAPEHQANSATTLAADEEHILRCLGAALIMQWNTLPTKLQRALFDSAGCMGDLLETAALRGQIARFLHKHKDDQDGDTEKSFVTPTTLARRVHGNAQQQAAELARWDDEGGAASVLPENSTETNRNIDARRG